MRESGMDASVKNLYESVKLTEIIAQNLALSGIMARVRCEPGWSLSPAWSRSLQDFDLWLVWAGRGRMQIGDTATELIPGRCLWMRPGRRYSASQDPEDRLGVSFVHFSLPGNPDFVPPFEVTEVRSLAYAQSALAEVVRVGAESPTLGARLLSSLLDLLAHDHRVAANREEQRRGGGVARGRHERRMVELAARIVEEPGSHWSVKSMAQEAGLAVDHFSRVFSQVHRERPQAYVLRQRMARARQLLRETHLAVQEIAHALGFRDPFYFSRQFRAFFGQPPSAFRKNLPHKRLISGESSA
ncbi:MAG: hypothetical protein SynsKO_28400 [Synoicihabitans sp.]